MASRTDKKNWWSQYKVYVHGPGAFTYMAMFLKEGLQGTSDIDQADIVVFTGGEDVNPAIYGEKNCLKKASNGHMLPVSFINKERDDRDLKVFGYAHDKFKVGICRGGQLLNVANGGSMWQDVDGHAGGPHNLVDTVTGEVVKVSSTHHQMMRPGEDGLILAVARESSKKLADGDEWHIEHDAEERPSDMADVEVVWYEGSRSLCFQPHPEFDGYNDCTDYFFSLLERMLA